MATVDRPGTGGNWVRVTGGGPPNCLCGAPASERRSAAAAPAICNKFLREKRFAIGSPPQWSTIGYYHSVVRFGGINGSLRITQKIPGGWFGSSRRRIGNPPAGLPRKTASAVNLSDNHPGISVPDPGKDQAEGDHGRH